DAPISRPHLPAEHQQPDWPGLRSLRPGAFPDRPRQQQGPLDSDGLTSGRFDLRPTPFGDMRMSTRMSFDESLPESRSRAQRNARQGVPREASRTKDLPGGVSGASPMRTQTRSLVDPQYDHLFTERERDIVHRLLASESTRTIAEKTGLTVS